MATTKTLGPLHFEDLEPKRFEDLARQLIYDFKPWRKLEATGRAGTDDGFDARGYEMLSRELPVASSLPAIEPVDEDADGSEAALSAGHDDRLWLVQCKREREIGPTKLVRYMDDILLAEDEVLYGVVLTAACDFSKKARDAFTKKCRELGVQEWHLWGKAELEDRLFQPQNDHLLFAYFGISLTIRRRSQRTDLRAKLAMKRKAARVLQKHERGYLLLRPSVAPTYPYPVDVRDTETKEPPWKVRQYRGLAHNGLLFCTSRHFAFLDDDGVRWDAAMALNDVCAPTYDDPWRMEDAPDDLRSGILDCWLKLPESNRAWLEVLAVIPFENVLDIDELGDEIFESPHLYLALGGKFDDFFEDRDAKVETISNYSSRQRYLENSEVDRIVVFPDDLRKATTK